MKILIVYGSTHRHTERIAARMAYRMREQGHEVVMTDRPRRKRAADFDAILVGGRVHGSSYPWRVMRFIRSHLSELQARPSAFFSVSLLQLSKDPVQRIKTEALPRWATAKRGWIPDRIEVIAGGLNWNAQYGRLARLAKIMWRRALGPQLDVTRGEQELTDWNRVDQFVDSFLQHAASRSRQTSAGAAA